MSITTTIVVIGSADIFQTKKLLTLFGLALRANWLQAFIDPTQGKLTVEPACQGFLAHCEGRLCRDERMTRKMLIVYRGHINNHILHAEHGVAAWRLSQFTAKVVRDFRDRLRDAGATVVTTRKILATLHSVLEYAISQDWIATNPAHAIKAIGSRAEGSTKIAPPTKSDLQNIIEAAKPEPPTGAPLCRFDRKNAAYASYVVISAWPR